MACAIGSSKKIKQLKRSLLNENTLEAVFSLPSEVFYPGASVQACCMIFTLGKRHHESYETFFGYYKDDGFKKKKNLGRVEAIDINGHGVWSAIEAKWLDLYRNKKIVPGLSAVRHVNSNDEWLAEAYMETDYTSLLEVDFQRSINDYLSYLVKIGEVKDDRC